MEERGPLRTLGEDWCKAFCFAYMNPRCAYRRAKCVIVLASNSLCILPAHRGAGETLGSYLKALACPHSLELLDLGQRRAVADWLLTEAVGLEYLDNSARCSSRADAAGALPPAFRTMDYSDTEVQELVASLAQMLKIPAAETTAETVALVERTVREKLTPAALAAFHDNGGATRDESLEKFPQDFCTGNVAVDAGSKVLRLLYIEDLRRLQTAVNNVIVRAQAFTANPKTDARLGKVGF